MEVKEAIVCHQPPQDAIPPGYKQTEVGIIPEDWEVKTLQKLTDKIMVGIASAATHAYRDRGVVMFRNQNIKPGHLDDTDVLYIDDTYEDMYRNKRLKAGDLLTARTGYPGTTCIVSPKYEGAQSFTTLITRPRRNLIDSRYLCCFINSEVGQKFFEQNQIGGGQKNVNAGSLKQLSVSIPPTKTEQEAIAGALSDADALIESLEQLIAKKRLIKQGAMQELLTGKKRLPGFETKPGYKQTEVGMIPEDWEVRSIAQIAPLQRGLDLPTSQLKEGPYPVVYSNGVMNFHDTAMARGPGVVTGRSGTLGKVHYIDTDYWPHNTSLWVTRFNGNAPRYVFYLFTFIGFERFASGSGVPTLNRNDAHSFCIAIPPKRAEQEAIASVLFDMDANIATLESKLAKARQLKQGMMQQLLTGRIRLV